MKKILVDKDVLYKLYIVENKSQKEVSKLLKISLSKVKSSIKEYGIRKDKRLIQEIKERTSLKNYGVKSPTQSEIVQGKIKKTNIERYGVERPTQNPSILRKVKATNRRKYGKDYYILTEEFRINTEKKMLEKYGCINPFSSEEIKEKIKETNLSKYGFENVSKSEEIKLKKTKTFIEKYGAPTSFQSQEIRDKIDESNLKKFGTINPMKNKAVALSSWNSKVNSGKTRLVFGKTIPQWSKEYSFPEISLYKLESSLKHKTEEEFRGFLSSYKKSQSTLESFIEDRLGLLFYNKKIAKELPYRPDFKLSDNLALNADGLYWHSEKVISDKKYHYNMRLEYERHNLSILQFRSDEILNPVKIKIVESIISNKSGSTTFKVGARKTDVINLPNSDAKLFLESRHLKGHKNAKHIGLVYEGKVISVMSYVIRGECLKVERFCSELNTSVPGGLSKMLSFLSKKEKFESIHYWVDLRYGSGMFLENLGFKLERETLGWDWTDGHTTFNRLRCRANMDDRYLTEKEHAKELGWYKIYDAGQRLFAKYL